MAEPLRADWYVDYVSPFAYRRAERFDRLEIEVTDQALSAPEVQGELRRNTERAAAQGVFGVPAFVLGDELFWGEDATAMLLHRLERPDWLRSPEPRRISELPVGVRRSAG